MQGTLFCNASKCRRPINTGSAWVTSCCHVFCYEDGKSIIDNGMICPACSTHLSRKHGIISFDTNPNKTYRSMILTGQRPDVVMDVCQKAISAWVYQYNNELLCRQSMLQRSEKKLSEMKHYCEKLIYNLQEENKILKTQLATSNADLMTLKRKYDEVSNLLNGKVMHCKKLEATCEHLKRSSWSMKECSHRSDGGGDTRSEKEFFFGGGLGRSTGNLHARMASPVERFPSRSSTPKKCQIDFSRPGLFQSHTPDMALFDSFSRKFIEKMQE